MVGIIKGISPDMKSVSADMFLDLPSSPIHGMSHGTTRLAVGATPTQAHNQGSRDRNNNCGR